MREITQAGFLKRIEQILTNDPGKRFCFVMGWRPVFSSYMPTEILVREWMQEIYDVTNRDQDLPFEEWLTHEHPEIPGYVKRASLESNYNPVYKARFREFPEEGIQFLERMKENSEPSRGMDALAFILLNTKHDLAIVDWNDGPLYKAIAEMSGSRERLQNLKPLTVKGSAIITPNSVVSFPDIRPHLKEREGRYIPIFLGGDDMPLEIIEQVRQAFPSSAYWCVPHELIGASSLYNERDTLIEVDDYDELLDKLAQLLSKLSPRDGSAPTSQDSTLPASSDHRSNELTSKNVSDDSMFVGRTEEMWDLSEWVGNQDAGATLYVCGIGGSGKTYMASYWLQQVVPTLTNTFVGPFTYSFRDQEATVSSFCRTFFEFAAWQNVQPLTGDISDEQKLFAVLRLTPFLVFLDDFDYLLAGYHRSNLLDSAEVSDLPDPNDFLRSEDFEFFRQLMLCGPSRILVASRSSEVISQICESANAPYQIRELGGLRPSEALQFASVIGLEVDSRNQAFLTSYLGGNPALIQVIAGMVLHDIQTAGDFNRWLEQVQEPKNAPSNESFIQKRNRLMGQALAQNVLPKSIEEALPTYEAEVHANDLILPSVRIPQELLENVANGECVCFVGSGLSARANIPTWLGFTHGLVDDAARLGLISRGVQRSHHATIDSGQLNAVADNMVRAYSGDNRGKLLEYYRRACDSRGNVPPIFESLTKIPFRALLTTNYDRILKDAYKDTDYKIGLTPLDSEELLQLHSGSLPYIVELYGDLDKEESIIYGPNDYSDAVRKNAAFQRYIEGIFFSRTIFFVGASLKGIQDYLDAFTFPSGTARNHYALVGVYDLTWQAQAEDLRQRYNIHVIPFDASRGDFSAVDQFVDDMVKKTKPSLSPKPAVQPQSGLRKISLENIGPFEKLDLEFPNNWKVILGNNGVGKTTILKAIAINIVGSDVNFDTQTILSNLLRSQQTQGKITLHTVANPSGYIVELQRVGKDVQVVPRGGRMIESEPFLLIGFPALRAPSISSVTGTQGQGPKRPSATDVLPLLRSVPDVRMDELKQWIVNVYTAKTDPKASPTDSAKADQMLNQFFDIVSQLTDRAVEGLDQVTSPPDYRVMVTTKDGSVAIEAISQGMTSLLSWVGVTLQRLYETYYDRPEVIDPVKEYFLLLMDEIDAHMHPRWQQELVKKLKKVFPNAQFIATTHSPLVVGGIPISEIVRYDRNAKGTVEEVLIDLDMSVGRTDQILTGDLFGLETARFLDPDSESKYEKYKILLRKANRTKAENRTLADLEDDLYKMIPPSPEDPRLRRARELVSTISSTTFTAENVKQIGLELLGKADLLDRALQRES